MTLDEILKEIKKVQNICIMAHEGPDGDAIGSSLGLFHILSGMGKNVEVLMKKVPETFAFLPDFEAIKDVPSREKFDMAIVVDCPDIKRVNSDLIPYFESAEVTAQFDHHMNNSMFADYNVVNHVTPACAQILVESLDYLEIEISKDAMTCFLTGIITDTGGFKNSGTSVETFFADGRISFTYINLEDEKNLELKDGDHEGIVEIGRNIKDVEVSIFLREQEKDYKISLRSNDYVNVAEVCMLFGGGGHIRAAGASTMMNLEEAKRALIKKIEKRLKGDFRG